MNQPFLPNNKITKFVIIALAAVLLAGFMIKVSVPIFNKILGSPDLSILDDYQPIGSIEIYDYNNNFAGVLQGEEDRQVVKLPYISDYAIQAVLAAEDSDFFNHRGFSFSAVTRAFFTNLRAGRVVQGGSTISQQMVKNLFIKEEQRYKRSFIRKIRELLIALEVENKYSKEKILEIYLNQVYFGNLAYGIERAAQRYFSKSSSRLTIPEAAYLAGLLTAPSYLSKNLDKAMERQRYVLNKMYEHGYISKEAYDQATKTPIKFTYSKGNLSHFPFYFSLIEQELAKRFTRQELKSLGLKVYTGLDPVAQRIAEESLTLGVTNAASGINQGALVMIDVASAEVRALVGGVGDFWRHQYNRAINVHTIGSAFKPFVYLTAFSQGVVDPSTIVNDSRLQIPDVSSETGFWEPDNFDGEFHGPISVRAAIVFSRNIPAVKVAMRTGIKNIIDTAKKAGIKTDMQSHLSLALGAQAFTPLEVSAAYATLARGGVYLEPIIIRKIVDNKGNLLEENVATPKSSLEERHVGQLVNILEDVVSYGTGTVAKIEGRPMAGKTGTADGSRDIWFIGFTPDYVTAVWCGNELNKQVLSRYATGGSTPAWIWHDFMTKFFEERPKPPRGFSFKDDYKLVSIDPITGLLATEYTRNPVIKRFTPGTEPTEYAPIPEVDQIKERDNEHSFREGTGNEDRELKSARRFRRYEARMQKAENEIKEQLESSDSPPEEGTAPITPQPKNFIIDSQSINDEQR